MVLRIEHYETERSYDFERLSRALKRTKFTELGALLSRPSHKILQTAALHGAVAFFQDLQVRYSKSKARKAAFQILLAEENPSLYLLSLYSAEIALQRWFGEVLEADYFDSLLKDPDFYFGLKNAVYARPMRIIPGLLALIKTAKMKGCDAIASVEAMLKSAIDLAILYNRLPMDWDFLPIPALRALLQESNWLLFNRLFEIDAVQSLKYLETRIGRAAFLALLAENEFQGLTASIANKQQTAFLDHLLSFFDTAEGMDPQIPRAILNWANDNNCPALKVKITQLIDRQRTDLLPETPVGLLAKTGSSIFSFELGKSNSNEDLAHIPQVANFG